MPQTVLITGCSSGIGRATALAFAQAGWNVAATMRDVADGGDLSAMPQVFVTTLDVQDRGSIEGAVAACIVEFGAIDVVINNAGFAINTIFESVPAEKARELFEVNLFGVLEVTRAILPHFRSRQCGTFVNVSSGAGVFALPLASLYNASKFAVEGFSESLSYELSSIGVTVKIVEPGAAPATGFPRRSIGEASTLTIPDEYRTYLAEAQAVFQRFRDEAPHDAIESIAQGIFDAATDGSEQLRYVLSEDIRPMVEARRGSSEREYMALMRQTFPFKATGTND
jgi:NAD(P)-dependent dehydrogenase (short-subunit alcohol dehydrogenase family)